MFCSPTNGLKSPEIENRIIGQWNRTLEHAYREIFERIFFLLIYRLFCLPAIREAKNLILVKKLQVINRYLLLKKNNKK